MKRPPRYDLPKAAPGDLRLVQLFVNTTDHENTRELLATPADLRAWFAARGIETGRVGAAALRRAHGLRDSLRTFAATGCVDAALKAETERSRLAVDLEHGRLAPRAPGIDGAFDALLAIVYDAVRDGRWERLKTCRNCGFAYWDASKNRSAAWCSMQLCGNRLKVRRFRARQAA
jgi:predicted RNA-binding Zn ribbon-like protein